MSDKENAFNRLVALFICKLVDESTKNEDDEVEFQYKQGTDTYETLQDRLQRLHRTVWRNSCVRKYSMFLLIIQNGYSQHIPVPNAKERLRIFRIRSVF